MWLQLWIFTMTANFSKVMATDVTMALAVNSANEAAHMSC